MQPYTAKWEVWGLFGSPPSYADPWVSLEDQGPAAAKGNIIYGGAGFGGREASTVLPMHEGANVFCMLEDNEAEAEAEAETKAEAEA